MLKYTAPCTRCGRIYAYTDEDLSTMPIMVKKVNSFGESVIYCETCVRDKQTEQERKKEELTALIHDRF